MTPAQCSFRCSLFTKESSNRCLADFAVYRKQMLGMSNIFLIITWAADNGYRYFSPVATSPSTTSSNSPAILKREFIYFHHVYSKKKIRAIHGWAHDYSISGFLLPGKPGALCAEGDVDAVQSFVEHIRHLPWQKMQTRHVEHIAMIHGASVSSSRCFSSFSELSPGVGEALEALQRVGLGAAIGFLFGMRGENEDG